MENKKESNSQRQIVRQSSAKLVNEWANNCNHCLNPKELVAITEVFTDYIQFGYSKELEERLNNIDEHLKNKQ